MQIRSARLGNIEIDPARVITFPDGIIGFTDLKRYVELEFLEDSPLRLLQAIDEPGLAFIVIDPKIFIPDFVAPTGFEDRALLKAEENDSLSVRVIVTIPENPYEMTANLQGPLVINLANHLAKQVIDNTGITSTRHKILDTTQSAVAAL